MYTLKTGAEVFIVGRGEQYAVQVSANAEWTNPIDLLITSSFDKAREFIAAIERAQRAQLAMGPRRFKYRKDGRMYGIEIDNKIVGYVARTAVGDWVAMSADKQQVPGTQDSARSVAAELLLYKLSLPQKG
jgi:hypothetical protein